MTSSTTPKADAKRKGPDDPEQSKAFIDKAKEIGADEKSKADDLMARLVKRKPEPRKVSDK